LKKTALLFFILFSCSQSFAQTPPVEIRTRAWPEKASLGDEITLFVRVDRSEGFSVEPPTAQVRLAPFELKRLDVLPSLKKAGRVIETFKLTLIAFELGDLTIPPVPFTVTDTTGIRTTLTSEPARVRVLPSAEHPKEKDDLKPIKGPVSLDTGFLGTLALGLLALALSVVLAVKIALRRRKKLLDLESLKPAHERAHLELERLKKKNLIGEGRTKEFYSELADILRRYLERRFDLRALDLTTAETLLLLREKGSEADVMEKIKSVLENSDLVKFAKFTPPPELVVTLERELVDVVSKTRPVAVERPSP